MKKPLEQTGPVLEAVVFDGKQEVFVKQPVDGLTYEVVTNTYNQALNECLVDQKVVTEQASFALGLSDRLRATNPMLSHAYAKVSMELSILSLELFLSKQGV